MGSITSWIRLEPRCRDASLQESVQARIYDPLWLLARQWQTAEFQGEDGGTPVCARWRGESAAVTRYCAGAVGPANTAAAVHYDARAVPLEALVERQAFGTPDAQGSIRLAVESGLHFLRMVEAQPTSRSYRIELLARFALLPPDDATRSGLDAETRSYWQLMAGRAPDARRIRAAFRDAQGRRIALPDDLGIEGADRAEVERAIDAWLAQSDALFSRPAPGEPEAWDPERLEYAFSVAAAPGGEEVALSATQYAEGHLDWHSVDVDPRVALGAAADGASAPLVRAILPAPVSFRGAPAQRYWEIEDAAIDYGLLPAGPGDIAHLMLSQFATEFGDDWYVIPIELGIGTLTVTRSLVVTDSFGVQTALAPVNDPTQPATGFSMFELSVIGSDGTPGRPRSNLLYLAPSVVRTLDGRPLEEVRFMRDEMANMAWAIEHAVPGPVEQRIEPAATREPAAAEPAPPAAMPRYRLATDVPLNWTPLLPQRAATDPPSLRLVRAAVLAPDGTNAIRRAQGELLGARPRLALFDEEIPRAGVRVTRQFEHTRWIGGSTLLWIGLRKQAGRGEGSSALTFDAAE
jgi:hypothetical protein